MPELAEVEYYRRQWDDGLGEVIRAVECNPGKRVFRGVDARALRRGLAGARLVSSKARGKLMAFQFGNGAWLGLHLGMTGHLRAAPAACPREIHDHLALRTGGRTLMFNDARCFGRILFHGGPAAPEWWSALPPSLTSKAFTFARMTGFLVRHRRAPIKAVLLRQEGFPGIGNWMADEILWRARLHPRTPAGALGDEPKRGLWRGIRTVCRQALHIIGKDFSDPPESWLFPHRWRAGGRCPRHGEPLLRQTVGGRTTAWCPRCQTVKCGADPP